jgi:hypothetical protein
VDDDFESVLPYDCEDEHIADQAFIDVDAWSDGGGCVIKSDQVRQRKVKLLGKFYLQFFSSILWFSFTPSSMQHSLVLVP